MKNSAYCTECQQCLQLFSAKLAEYRVALANQHIPVPSLPYSEACTQHKDIGPNRHYAFGNPMNTHEQKQLVKYIETTNKNRDYKPQSAAPLFPCDILRIHSHMESQEYPLSLLARYTMVLGAIYYGGCFDEYAEIRMCDFNKAHHLFEVNNNKIVAIAQLIKGKRDQAWYTYQA
jgi:hypothetical protein